MCKVTVKRQLTNVKNKKKSNVQIQRLNDKRLFMQVSTSIVLYRKDIWPVESWGLKKVVVSGNPTDPSFYPPTLKILWTYLC